MCFSQVEHRHQYLDKLRVEVKVLRPLLEECLDDDPAVRPTMAAVCERIQVNKNAYMNTTLHQKVEQLKRENRFKDRQLKQHLVRVNDSYSL